MSSARDPSGLSTKIQAGSRLRDASTTAYPNISPGDSGLGTAGGKSKGSAAGDLIHFSVSSMMCCIATCVTRKKTWGGREE